MRVLLDNRACPLTDVAADSIGAAVAQAADLAERAGRRVIDVEVDGEPWSDADLASAERLRGTAEEIRLTSVRPVDLLRDTFRHAAEALVEAETCQREAAKLLQGDRTQAGLDELGAALSVWMNIQQAVRDGLAFGGVELDSVERTCPGFNASLTELNLRLTALRDAMRLGDAVALCDCLLYEFPATTRRWAEVLTELARQSEALLAAPAR